MLYAYNQKKVQGSKYFHITFFKSNVYLQLLQQGIRVDQKTKKVSTDLQQHLYSIDIYKDNYQNKNSDESEHI